MRLLTGNGAPTAAGKGAAPAAKPADSAAAAATPAEGPAAELKEGLVEDGADSDEEEDDDEEDEADEADLDEAAAGDGAGPSAPQMGSAEQVPRHINVVRWTLHDVPQDPHQRHNPQVSAIMLVFGVLACSHGPNAVLNTLAANYAVIDATRQHS